MQINNTLSQTVRPSRVQESHYKSFVYRISRICRSSKFEQNYLKRKDLILYFSLFSLPGKNCYLLFF